MFRRLVDGKWCQCAKILHPMKEVKEQKGVSLIVPDFA